LRFLEILKIKRKGQVHPIHKNVNLNFLYNFNLIKVDQRANKEGTQSSSIKDLEIDALKTKINFLELKLDKIDLKLEVIIHLSSYLYE